MRTFLLPYVNHVVPAFTLEDLTQWRAEWPETVPVSAFTMKEFDLLRFAPSTLHKNENK